MYDGASYYTVKCVELFWWNLFCHVVLLVFFLDERHASTGSLTFDGAKLESD